MELFKRAKTIALDLKALKLENTQYKQIDVPPEMTPLVAKFQRAVRKAFPKKIGLVEAVKLALIREQVAARRRKDKNKW